MKVLVVGGGGREHALAWKLVQSPLVEKLYAAPGNAGTAQLGENLPIKATDIKALGEAAQRLGIGLTVVGPEAPLAEGIVDHFRSLDLPIFGPTRAAAQIEASKSFSIRLMEKYTIPCPRGVAFSSYDEAKSFVGSQPLPLVVKANGLAAGKGVTVATTREQALNALCDAMVKRVFGPAGEKVVIEEYLTGQEVSLLCFTDGRTVVPMAPACDYKRANDGDQGPNTGGMGGYSPPPFFPPDLVRQATEAILKPAVKAMAQEGRPYTGVLYAGLMLTPQGTKVLEFNCRFGDPETQVTLPLLKSDLVEIMLACIRGKLEELEIEWSQEACVGVVMASAGYPSSYRTGFPITGIDEAAEKILVFHAGTRQEGEKVVTDGGRVLTVVATGKDLAQARKRVYRHIGRVNFEGAHYRQDIAAREVKVCL